MNDEAVFTGPFLVISLVSFFSLLVSVLILSNLKTLVSKHFEELSSSRAERKELYTRMQLWETRPSESLPEPKTFFGPAVVYHGSSMYQDEAALAKEYGFKPNEDGGWIDEEDGDLYESITEAIEARKHSVKHGLPLAESFNELSILSKVHSA